MGKQTWTHCVVEFFPFIEPYFGHTGRIVQHNFGNAARESVRRFIAKYVTHMRTWDNF